MHILDHRHFDMFANQVANEHRAFVIESRIGTPGFPDTLKGVGELLGVVSSNVLRGKSMRFSEILRYRLDFGLTEDDFLLDNYTWLCRIYRKIHLTKPKEQIHAEVTEYLEDAHV